MTPGEVSRMLAALAAIVDHLDQLPRVVSLLEQLVEGQAPQLTPTDDRPAAFDHEVLALYPEQQYQAS